VVVQNKYEKFIYRSSRFESLSPHNSNGKFDSLNSNGTTLVFIKFLRTTFSLKKATMKGCFLSVLGFPLKLSL